MFFKATVQVTNMRDNLFYDLPCSAPFPQRQRLRFFLYIVVMRRSLDFGFRMFDFGFILFYLLILLGCFTDSCKFLPIAVNIAVSSSASFLSEIIFDDWTKPDSSIKSNQ
jgi:hypothetical protein